MTCPKCHGRMRTVNRQGVQIEQCENCRGIFLDHGELEHILSAENRYYGGATQYQPPGGGHRGHSDSPRPFHSGHSDSPRPYQGGHGGHADSPRPYYGGHSDSPRPYGHRKQKSFLSDLFD